MAEPATEALERRRAAILAGLRAVVPEADAQLALQLWEQRFAATKPLAIVELVSEISIRFRLPAKRADALRLSLYQSLLKLDARRGSARQQAKATNPNRRPADTVFQALIAALRDGVIDAGDNAPAHFHDALGETLGRLPLHPGFTDRMLGWAEGLADMPDPEPLTESQLASLVHASYVAACEALGPVQADRLLSRATTAAEQLPEARAFSPRKLL